MPLFGGAAAIAAIVSNLYLELRQKQARSRKGALGAYLVHLGLALVTLGVAISGPYQQSVEAVLSPGRTMEVSGFNVTYVDLEEETSPAMTIARAVLDGTRGGKPVGRLTPERRLYRGFEQPFAEVSTLPSLGNEL